MNSKPSQFWGSRSSGFKLLLILGLSVALLSHNNESQATSGPDRIWLVQAVDTVKYSRDLSREKRGSTSFSAVIDQQVADIAATGATHVSIGTPYDEEFWPMLEQWVGAARRHNLNVWFRGNWSGWEGWFGYPRIDRQAHLQKTDQLIRQHPHWFQDGDIFTACPECENGGPGDPRQNGDVAGHRQFLIDEYDITKKAFQAINRSVASNYNSMNGDVARLIMDKATTAATGGVVTVDHYVALPDQLASDLAEIAQQSGGKVVLGEFGAPILDIHGSLTDQQQADWINQTLRAVAQVPEVIGVNYWVNVGGRTGIWDEQGTAKPAVTILKNLYQPETISGLVQDELGRPLPNIKIRGDYGYATSALNGGWRLPHPHQISSEVTFSGQGYQSQTVQLKAPQSEVAITLAKQDPNIVYRLHRFARVRLARLFNAS